MNGGIGITGWGAVSPAGWGVPALREALARGEPLPLTQLEHPAQATPLAVRRVPLPPVPLPCLAHPRLRRASAVTQFAVAAAVEALGANPTNAGALGVITAVFSGSVTYSRRFYDEAMRKPATASPLLFPETVFNAPSSHLSAVLGTKAINYTLVGDAGAFLTTLALAAQWIATGRVTRCLVVGAEEVDWISADAVRLFDRRRPSSEGAGALLLEAVPHPPVTLSAITDECSYSPLGQAEALAAMRAQLLPTTPNTLLCSSAAGLGRMDRAENALWRDWSGPRLTPKMVLGEGLMASPAWQCVAAVDALARGQASSALVSVAGLHQHALGAWFTAGGCDRK